MDPLARLFGSYARLKLLRLFVFNEDASFAVDDIVFRTKTLKEHVRKELTVLTAAGIVRKKSGKGGTAYTVDRKFPHYEPLQAFLRTTTNMGDAEILGTLKRAGSLRIVTLSGMFTGVIETKIDLLVVGDKLDEKILATAVHAIEAELGRELSYASFTTEDFRYRVGVYDRLIRDVMDYPHRTILDKVGIEHRR
jgi:predicted nucleotidyltransferase